MNSPKAEIVLIEDSMDDAELTIRSLKKRKLSNNIFHFEDGEEALEYLIKLNRDEHPKLILLDIKMPKISGIEVLKTIKAHEHLKFVPVVMMTSSKQESDIIESYELGVNGYVVKPVQFDEFSEVVSNIGLFWLIVNQPPN